jgi:putative membrane protein
MESHPDQKPPTSTELGVTRTALSAERTLMSWVRTALAMISFGFTIYKFMHALAAQEARSPRHFGIFLAALGTVSLAAGTFQYRGIIRSLGGPRPGFTIYVALAVIAVGLLVLFALVLRLGPLA